MIKKLILLAVVMSATPKLNAQQYIAEGDQSFAIGIDPIFTFVGNMFNNSENNYLNLNSYNIIYRKFTSPTTARRIKFNGEGQHSNTSYDDRLTTRTSYNLQFAIGKEYRKNFNRLSTYAGYEWFVGASNSQLKYTYNEEMPSYQMNRPVSSNSGYGFSTGVGAVLGAEYFVTKHIFIGLEAVMPLSIGYRTDRVQVSEERVPNNEFVILTNEERFKNGLQVNFHTNSWVNVRGGFLF